MPLWDFLGLVRSLIGPAASATMPEKDSFSAPAVVGSKEKPVINLLRGWPNQSLLPIELIKEAARAALSDTSVAYPGLEYGPDAGNQAFRDAVAAWLTSFYQPTTPISAERICISGGASQSLGNIISVYTDPEYTRNIWLVSPTYMLVFRIFEDAGFHGKLRAVPEDEEGVDIAFLRREITRSEDQARDKGNTAPRYKLGRDGAKVYKHIVYCVPSFSNPSSRTMTEGRRVELVRLAREFDALVVCDDVYDVLQFPAHQATDSSGSADSMQTSHMPRLVSIDVELDGGTGRPGPGLRCGWIEATEKFAHGVSQAGVQRSGGAPCQLTSTYLTHMLVNGQIQKHIDAVLRPAYARRYQAMTAAIQKHLHPLGFTMPQTNRKIVGGYFLWLGLPDGLYSADLAQKCQEEESLIIAPGKIFEVPGDNSIRYDRQVRLCFAFEDVPKLSEAITRIAHVTRRMLAAGEDNGSDYVVVEAQGSSREKLQDFM